MGRGAPTQRYITRSMSMKLHFTVTTMTRLVGYYLYISLFIMICTGNLSDELSWALRWGTLALPGCLPQ